jgi:hypothetical protein
MLYSRRGAIRSADHHREYLSSAVAALTPEGHARVDVILDELAAAVSERSWLLRFAKAREGEADTGREGSPAQEPALMLSRKELGFLTVGFRTIRDQEPLDDVANWANAVLALLKDDQPARGDHDRDG